MTDVNNMEDVLDVRDIIERFEELESERADLVLAIGSAKDVLAEANTALEGVEDNEALIEARDDAQEALEDAQKDLVEWDACSHGDEAAEFARLTELLDDLKGNGGDHQWRGDWYPTGLVRDSYWKEYAMEFADDIGAINKDIGWPGNCIDWDKAASQLQIDYSSVEYDGVTYWYR